MVTGALISHRLTDHILRIRGHHLMEELDLRIIGLRIIHNLLPHIVVRMEELVVEFQIRIESNNLRRKKIH